MLVELRGLVKEYGHGARTATALRGISLVIGEGQMVAVVGPNGAGKTTLLNLVGGLDSPTRGSVLVDGTDLGRLDFDGLAAFHRRVGIVFQTLGLRFDMCAWENAALPLLVEGVRPEVARPQAVGVLESLGLLHHAERLPIELSISERQRVAIARALVGHPALVLADEPTGYLDAATSATVVQLFRSRVAAEGATVVIASHHASTGAACDRRIELMDGRLAGEVELVGRATSPLPARVRRRRSGPEP